MRSRCRPGILLYAALLVGLAFPGGRAVAQTLSGDQLLDPQRLIDVRITLPQREWNRLRRQRRQMSAALSGGAAKSPFRYVKADIVIDGTAIRSVGIRKKGFYGSIDSTRPSLKVKFDEFRKQDPVEGLSRLTLNNNKQDTSLVSQLLTYRLCRDAGVHAPRSNFAKVTVNGEFLGIYSNVESIKKPFLKRSFGDKTGRLYEGTFSDFHPDWVMKLEAKTSESRTDRRRITQLAKLLAAKGDLNLEEVEQIINLDNFLRFWALEGLLRIWDGYTANQNNFYFYDNPADGRCYFIPWGADIAFTKTAGQPPGQRLTCIYAQSLLAHRLYKTNGLPQRYRDTMLWVLNEVWNEDQLIAEIDRVEQLVQPHLHEQQQGTAAAMDSVRDFIRTRREVVEQELADWPQNAPPIPRIVRPFRP